MNIITRQCLKILKSEIKCQNQTTVGRLMSFKSAVSLENIYPSSNMRLHTPNFVPEDPDQKFNGFIPMDKIKITCSRSSGPGGQNVNKVNTKVDLRFQVNEATWLDQEIREKMLEQCKNKINKEGYLVIKSELTSSQQLNVADALEKLRKLIRQLLVKPPEISEESATLIRKRQILASQRRVYSKRIRSQIRQDRQGPDC